jgi:hypothetical protein
MAGRFRRRLAAVLIVVGGGIAVIGQAPASASTVRSSGSHAVSNSSHSRLDQAQIRPADWWW